MGTRGMEVGKDSQVGQGSGTIRKAEDWGRSHLGFSSSRNQYGTPKTTLGS